MSPLADANFPDGLKSKPGRPGQPGTEDRCASSLSFLKSPLADALTSDALKRRSGRPRTATRCTSSPAQLRSPRATSDTTIVILDGSSISPLTDYPVDANRCETILASPDQRVWSEMGRLATPDGGTNLIGLVCTLCKICMGGGKIGKPITFEYQERQGCAKIRGTKRRHSSTDRASSHSLAAKQSTLLGDISIPVLLDMTKCCQPRRKP